MLFDRRDVDSIEGGAWVDGSIVPAFGDGRVKVRGMGADTVKDFLAKKARMAPPKDRVDDGSLLPSVAARNTREAISAVVLVEVDGIGAELVDVRKMLLDPAYGTLAGAILTAAYYVDTLSQAEDYEKN